MTRVAAFFIWVAMASLGFGCSGNVNIQGHPDTGPDEETGGQGLRDAAPNGQDASWPIDGTVGRDAARLTDAGGRDGAPGPDANPGSDAGQYVGPTVVVNPVEIDDLLFNPHRGIQTWAATYSQATWLGNLPSTCVYVRYYWDQLEPANGQYNWSAIDNLIDAAEAEGETFAFRVMTAAPGAQKSPGWLESAGCPFLTSSDGTRAPDLDDPTCWSFHERLIRALGARYDGRRALEFVDIGSVGLWGEWHTFPIPSQSTLRRIVDLYFDAFPNTPYKIALIAAGDPSIGDILSYAFSKGAGLRADGLGGWGWFETQGWDYYMNGKPEQWQIAPYVGEAIQTIADWGSRTAQTVDNELARHFSYFNWQRATISPSQQADVERFVRGMGYRLVLRRIEFPRNPSAGQVIQISMDWENVGDAPPYWDYEIAFRLSNPNHTTGAMRTGTSVKGWLPGGHTVNAVVTLPSGLPPGAYDFAVGLLPPDSDDPAVHLAIQGGDPEGWYQLGTMQIQ